MLRVAASNENKIYSVGGRLFIGDERPASADDAISGMPGQPDSHVFQTAWLNLSI